jgi:hypothetical protein
MANLAHPVELWACPLVDGSAQSGGLFWACRLEEPAGSAKISSFPGLWRRSAWSSSQGRKLCLMRLREDRVPTKRTFTILPPMVRRKRVLLKADPILSRGRPAAAYLPCPWPSQGFGRGEGKSSPRPDPTAGAR